MKTFLSDIFPKLQQFSEKLDNLTLLTNQHWVFIDDLLLIKTVYIFRPNNELLISSNGKVEKAKWEFLGNKSLLIDKEDESYLFKHGFFDENILALKVDSSEEYAVFINENNYGGELNSIDRIYDFLKRKYLDASTKGTTVNSRNHEVNSNVQTVFRETKDDIVLKIVSLNYKTIGAKVFIDEKPAPDGIYVYKSNTHKLILKGGAIVERYFIEQVKEYVIEKSEEDTIAIGDKVYLKNGAKIKDGKYKYSFFKSIIVENGRIIK